MKLQDQVCSIELAKRLKELGVQQESYWYWQPCENTAAETWSDERPFLMPSHMATSEDNVISAFSVAELGEMLSEKIVFREPYTVELPSRVGDGWVFMVPIVATSHLETTTAHTEADARAKTLIYLLENGVVTSKP